MFDNAAFKAPILEDIINNIIVNLLRDKRFKFFGDIIFFIFRFIQAIFQYRNIA